jgi:hypothetical protein
MNATNSIPHFECRELRTIIPQVVKKGQEFYDKLPPTDKIAHKAMSILLIFSISFTVGAVAYSGLTFTALPLAAAAGLWGLTFVAYTVSSKYFKSLNAVYAYNSMRYLPKSLIEYANNPNMNPTGLTKDLEKVVKIEFEDGYDSAFIMQEFIATAYMQIALNELRNTCFKTQQVQAFMLNEKSEDSIQRIHFAPKMRFAAKMASSYITDRRIGLEAKYAKHLSMLILMMSYKSPMLPKEKELSQWEKADLFGKNKSEIQETLNKIREAVIPMVDYVIKNNDKEKQVKLGLDTYLNKFHTIEIQS